MSGTSMLSKSLAAASSSKDPVSSAQAQSDTVTAAAPTTPYPFATLSAGDDGWAVDLDAKCPQLEDITLTDSKPCIAESTPNDLNKETLIYAPYASFLFPYTQPTATSVLPVLTPQTQKETQRRSVAQRLVLEIQVRTVMDMLEASCWHEKDPDTPVLNAIHHPFPNHMVPYLPAGNLVWGLIGNKFTKSAYTRTPVQPSSRLSSGPSPRGSCMMHPRGWAPANGTSGTCSTTGTPAPPTSTAADLGQENDPLYGGVDTVPGDWAQGAAVLSCWSL
ncbi:hypothetical protein DFH09DRAFT_1111221 [Mycena vulgaris]|nr:hypothetical protein DFH09DRAFT_1111221 [Mycena vulgaris]